MDKIFIDFDVFPDVFAKREPFYSHSAVLLNHVENKKIKGFTSPLVIANIHYILRKLKSKNYAFHNLRKLRLVVSILSVHERHIDEALNSKFSDFEDAVQFYSSKAAEIDCIITRNKKDYKHSTISVCTPEEYLGILQSRI